MFMLCFVTSVKKLDNGYIHSALSNKGYTIFKCDKEYSPGSWLDVEGHLSNLDDDTIEVLPNKITISIKHKKEEEKMILDFINKKSKIENSSFFFNYEIMKFFEPLIEEAAQFIKKATVLKRPIIVRYDSDQDGLTAALGLYYALKDYYNIKFIQQPFPYYSLLDFEDDKRYIDNLEAKHLPPVLILLDFGSNPESMDGYRKAVENGFSVVVIDHHPPQNLQIGELITVWVSGWITNSNNPSSYTGGLLSCEIAKKINKIEKNIIDKLIRISLTADRSNLYSPSNRDLKDAEAVGYIIGSSTYENNIVQYAKAVNDEEMLDFAYAQSQEKIQDFIQKASKVTKVKKINNLTFYLVNVTKIIKKGSYPNKGLGANIMADLYGKKNYPVVTVVYTGRNISFRLNKPAIDIGIDLSKAILDLKSQMLHGIESGGGHRAAAALRIKPGYLKDALDKILHLISNQNIKK